MTRGGELVAVKDVSRFASAPSAGCLGLGRRQALGGKAPSAEMIDRLIAALRGIGTMPANTTATPIRGEGLGPWSDESLAKTARRGDLFVRFFAGFLLSLAFGPPDFGVKQAP